MDSSPFRHTRLSRTPNPRRRAVIVILVVTLLGASAAAAVGPDLLASLASRRARFEEKMKNEGKEVAMTEQGGKFLRAKDAEPIDTLPQKDPYRQRGVYLTSGSIARADFLDTTIDRLLASGGSSIVFDVKGYYVYFETGAPIANEIGTVKSIYDLPGIVAKLKARGIYTIARFISLKDPQLAEKVPETQVRTKAGRIFGSTWTDGSHPITLEYNRQILVDLLKSGIDEVNLDYIRYSTEWPNSTYGLTGAEKAQKVLAFIKMVRETIDDVHPQTKFGISTYAILGWNFAINLEPLGQDFTLFAPYVDIISPMAYPSTFAQTGYYVPGRDPRSRSYFLVYRTLKGYHDLLPEDQRHKLRPWIQGYSMTPQDLRDEMDAVYDSGLCGFQLWSAGNLYDTAYTEMAKEGTRQEKCRTSL